MESTEVAGNTSTDSISARLYGTHINRTPTGSGSVIKDASATVYSALYANQQFIQLSVTLKSADKPMIVLRRVEDSYVNASQMLHILVALNYFTADQVKAFLDNKVVSNPQYLSQTYGTSEPLLADLSDHHLFQIRGIWIPYDKAVSIAVNFDLYKLLRKLFLVDVHDYDKFPAYEELSPQPTEKRPSEEARETSPTKKIKKHSSGTKLLIQTLLESIIATNINRPSVLPPVVVNDNAELIAEAKAQFSEIFKTNGKDSQFYTSDEISTRFASIILECSAANIKPSSVLDVPLDPLGRTALHYAATLAADNLVGILIELKINSPIRGDNNGESPLVASVQVTNAIEKGNFLSMLSKYLWPNLWLFDNKCQSILHHLILVASHNYKGAKFYFGKILEWVITNPDRTKNLHAFCRNIVNAKEAQDGSTALHWAGNNELKWFIFLLLELNANPEAVNNLGVKPIDFDCVKQVVALRNAYRQSPVSSLAVKTLLEGLDDVNEDDEYLILLVQTGVEFLNKLAPFENVGVLEELSRASAEPATKAATSTSTLQSLKILNSIQELLVSNNVEFENVINAKKAEINALNDELRDATILTANNRFVIRKVSEKISSIDMLKLQLANVNEKLQMLKAETTDNENNNSMKEEECTESINVDEPFIIKSIYDKLVNDEPIEPTTELMDSLPPTKDLRAQLAAYEELNASLEREADCLQDYSALTCKFKKVVSFCTGVNLEEVDDLLDGLLAAIEGQQ